MSSIQEDNKSFVSALFDFGFTSYITLKFLRVIYALVMGLIGLGALVFFIALVSRGGAMAALAIIVVPVVAFLYLVFARLSLEFIAVIFRIAENTSVLAAAATTNGGTPGTSAPGYYGAPPQAH